VRLEQKARAELYLARVADTGHEVGGLPEIRAPGVTREAAAKVGRVEQVERLHEHAELAATFASEVEKLCRPKVHQVRRIASSRVVRDLLAGRGIDVAVVVGSIGVQVGACGQIVRTRARELAFRPIGYLSALSESPRTNASVTLV
jgi:hypothetical protein